MGFKMITEVKIYN